MLDSESSRKTQKENLVSETQYDFTASAKIMIDEFSITCCEGKLKIAALDCGLAEQEVTWDTMYREGLKRLTILWLQYSLDFHRNDCQSLNLSLSLTGGLEKTYSSLHNEANISGQTYLF